MQLEKIITLANENTRLRFLSMERSLRSTGCELPLWVIPYDEKKFNLPVNAHWWELKNVSYWLEAHQAHRMMRKYQCLLESNYQFVDSDVIFLKNPERVLTSFSGFITSCGHWHNPSHVITKEVLNFFEKSTTTWQQKIFNAGQFACDKKLYDFNGLKIMAEQPENKDSCISFRFHDQPGLNLLVNLSGIPVTNITLQPYCMESTWAGDYKDEDYSRFWNNESKKPYIIHWAGCNMSSKRPIDKLFFEFLTKQEREEWNKKIAVITATQNTFQSKLKTRLRKLKAAVKLAVG